MIALYCTCTFHIYIQRSRDYFKISPTVYSNCSVRIQLFIAWTKPFLPFGSPGASTPSHVYRTRGGQSLAPDTQPLPRQHLLPLPPSDVHAPSSDVVDRASRHHTNAAFLSSWKCFFPIKQYIFKKTETNYNGKRNKGNSKPRLPKIAAASLFHFPSKIVGHRSNRSFLRHGDAPVESLVASTPQPSAFRSALSAFG
jgi:hypothetical protein